MLLSEMLSDLQRRLDYPASHATEITTRHTAFLNEALQEIVSDPGIGQLLTVDTTPNTITTVSGTAEYSVSTTDRITAITERTNDIRLRMLSFDDYRRMEPDPVANTGTPSHWVPMSYVSVALWPTPSAVIAYTVDNEVPVTVLVSPSDTPAFPARFHRLLVDGALVREYQKRDNPQQQVLAQRKFDEGLKALRYYITCPPDFLPVRGRNRVGRSRLGGGYPDGSGVW